MLDLLPLMIWLAAALALFGIAVRRDRAALVLLASLAMAETMARSGLAFHPVWWAMLDAAVFLLIARKAMPRRDVLILALFAPAWAAYLLPEVPRYVIISGVVIAQFLLTFPLKEAWARAKATPMPDSHHHFDLRERAA